MLLACFPTSVRASDVMTVIHPADEEKGDPRFNDVKEILRMALEKTVAEFGPYELRASALQTNGLRYLSNLARENDLNVVWSSTTVEKERNYLPIRIPLRKGILGYRILLVHKDKQGLLTGVKSLDDLKKFSVGQGVGWDDVKLYEANGVKVIEAKYSNLFRMLSYQRFDFFPRGINEIFNEFEKESPHNPDLVVDDSLLLYYPWPYYFFVSKTNTKLHKRLSLGLQKMIKDGSFDAIFWKYNGKAIEAANFKKRRVIHMTNHLLPKETPLNDASLWYRPKLN
ncbi:transporter substrate-binding domain-containing protein [Undibacterium sp. LX40W]|uniref:Transporter substrate-binding domain-containing protein n=2 Tax=Oxalobacteraceae TaxID=75682 RepID=A0A923KUM8_9BURK|nr:transporter substrate-binding domain-containing protein [Undibacterium nitidum]MBC3893135.1 transporter substrate-binding domain-containing protein [Undibacterium sp. LX40W]